MPDRSLERIHTAVRQYGREILTVAEFINLVFLELGYAERFDLVDKVARLMPQSRRVIEIILQPGSSYAPFTIGTPADPQAWRRRMQLACNRLRPFSGSTWTRGRQGRMDLVHPHRSRSRLQIGRTVWWNNCLFDEET